MANTSNTPKMTDPTAAALSAIQDALNVRDAENGRDAEPSNYTSNYTMAMPLEEAMADDEPAPEPAWPGLRAGNGSRSGNSARSEPLEELPRLDDTDLLHRPANDDRESIGQILRSLQRHPARTSYFLASIFAAAWIIGGMALGYAYLPHIEETLGPGGLTAPFLAVAGAIYLAPVIIFYVLAQMAWRSQELRLIAESMAEVAMRLAEPETVARESIVTVGQAVRREVAAMGDGIERALGRATELETLVANEVSALEHAYNDNEVRIRALLEDLGGRRDTLVGQAEQIRQAINNIHLDLNTDISHIGQLVVEQVNEASRRVTHALAEEGEHITRALNHAGDTMLGALGERGGDLLERLEATSSTTSDAIAAAGDRLTATLNFKTDHIGDEFNEIAANIQQMMSVRLDDVSESFSRRSVGILDLMSGRTQQLTDQVVETSNHLADSITSRIEEVNTTLKNTGDSLVLDLSLRGGDVVSKLEQTGASITDTLVERGNKVGETISASAESIAQAIGERGDAVREMLAERLQPFEDMFNHGPGELAERIARDTTMLGNLITRHLGEFDRTVKTYGSEMVERVGERTQEVIAAMRDYVDSFDTRINAKAAEITTILDQQFTRFHDALDGRTKSINEQLTVKVADFGGKISEVTTTVDQQFSRFQTALDGRSQTLSEALSSHVMGIAKTMADGGKEVVAALDQRINGVTDVVNVRGAQLGETIGAKFDDIDRALASRAVEVANSMDARISRFEELLLGRAEVVTREIETRGKAAADALAARMGQLTHAITTNTSQAEHAIEKLATASTEVIITRLEQLNAAIKTDAGGAERSLAELATSTTTAIRTSAQDAERTLMGVSTDITGRLKQNASEVERTLTGVSAGVSNVLKQNANDVERKLLAVSAEVSSGFVGKADEIAAAVNQRAAEMTHILDDKRSVLLSALGNKSAEFASEVARATDHALKAIEAKGFGFTKTMMDNSEQIARLINQASEVATTSVGKSIQQLQKTTQEANLASAAAVGQSVKQFVTTAQEAREATAAAIHQQIEELQNNSLGASRNASAAVARTLSELQEQTHSAVEHSKQTAAAAVSEMLETHGKLRSDTTALFERLREANILLQEVLTGAHQNMSEIERTVQTRVSEFVAAMNDVTQKTGVANSSIEHNILNFETLATKTVNDLGQLVAQFDAHGRSLGEAIALIDQSNRRTEGAVGDRRNLLETLVQTLDGKANDLDQRLARFSGLLDQSLERAAAQAREIARVIAELTTGGGRAITENFEVLRVNLEDQGNRTMELLRSVCKRATGDADAMFTTAAQRFTEVVEGLKRMSAEMQYELGTTRAELRKGILELPQETAESAAQMRRVIVDQIEALAELNRIVARHGRGLDTLDPVVSKQVVPVAAVPTAGRDELVAANGSARSDFQPRGRADVGATSPPSRSRAQEEAEGGWLSELLTLASRAGTERTREPVPETARDNDRPPHTIESLDALAVDIARMIDYDAAAELWERYKQGESNVFINKLCTMQGQHAFDEIRRKYRSDREFMQTVDRYIAEFERVLDEVSRDDGGQLVARTYLTTETGKVYTMLAHAAGRFD